MAIWHGRDKCGDLLLAELGFIDVKLVQILEALQWRQIPYWSAMEKLLELRLVSLFGNPSHWGGREGHKYQQRAE